MRDKLKILSSRRTLRQFFSFALVGVLINVLGYSIYLFLTYLWGAPKLTMTILYLVGASIGFLANRRFTFLHSGSIGFVGVKYLLAQVAGYLLNLALLLLFVAAAAVVCGCCCCCSCCYCCCCKTVCLFVFWLLFLFPQLLFLPLLVFCIV